MTASTDGSPAPGSGVPPKRIKRSNVVHPLIDLALTLFFFYVTFWGVTELSKSYDLIVYNAVVCGSIIVLIISTSYGARCVGSMFSRRVMLTRPPYVDVMADPLKMRKFCDQAWQFAVHFFCSLFEMYVIYENSNWWFEPASCWTPDPSQQTMSEATKLLFILQFQIWAYTGFSCRFLEEKHNDYVVMMAHHSVTILLILSEFASLFFVCDRHFCLSMIIRL
jgi:hypothetical protein